jgi:hypothetical protein
VGFLWGSGTVSRRCGVSVGSPKPLTGLAGPAQVPKSRRLPDPNDHFPVTQCHQGDLADCGGRRAQPSLTVPRMHLLGPGCTLPIQGCALAICFGVDGSSLKMPRLEASSAATASAPSGARLTRVAR